MKITCKNYDKRNKVMKYLDKFVFHFTSICFFHFFFGDLSRKKDVEYVILRHIGTMKLKEKE